MRRVFLLPLVLALAGCANTASQRTILQRAQAEVARREAWADTAYLRVVSEPNNLDRFTWKVSAGAFDFSDYPEYTGPNLVPGTERVIRFTRDGCLMGYHRRNTCTRPQAETPATDVEPMPVTDSKASLK